MVYSIDKNKESAIYEWVQEIEYDANVSYSDIMESVFEYFDMTNHPKRHLVWELAYSYGRGWGWREVVIYFEELLALVKD